MAKRKTYAEIEVKELGLTDIGKACREINKATIEEKIGLVVQLDDMISNLKVLSDNLTSSIKDTAYEEIVKDFKERGLWTFEDDIIIKVGDKFKVTLANKEGKEVVVSKAIKDVTSALPAKYKTTKIVVDEETIKSDYLAGSLEKILAPYVSVKTVKETKLKRTKIK